jgi:uncharacterized protein (AIM24 family)
MPTLFATVVAWLARKLGTLLVILGILVAGAWVSAEWTRLAQVQAEIRRAESIRDGLRTDVDRIEADIARHRAQWGAQTAAARKALDAELHMIDAELARQGPRWSDAIAKFADVEQRAMDARRAADVARIRRDELEAESAWWDVLIRRDRIAALQAARARFAALDGVARAWESARDRLAPTFARSPVERLKRERTRTSQEKALLLASTSPEVERLLDVRERKQREIAAAEGLVESQRRRVEQEPGQRLLSAAMAALPTALWILVGLMLAPVLIKGLLYFVLAPLASRLPPIRILADAEARDVAAPDPSAVSLPLDVRPGEEILVHADFLQSSSQAARKDTQWFLNPALPFTSIASGMFILTRIRPEGSAATRVVVSSQNDAFGEVGAIQVPERAALIVQPRSLAGLIKRVGEPIRITRHWRLASLHAWLTLQLRYLAFHGPCTLILKGCRGVRAERPDPGRPRLINQAATLGFSANLDYRNTRCETFVSYLRGKEALFNDLFAGGPGLFIYEEMPAGGRRSGIVGRGLEGALDAVLKAFGI